MKKLLFMMLVAFMMLPAMMRAQDNIIIGTGTSTTSQPFYGLYANSWCEMIYSADDITSSGNITALAWDCSAVNEKVYTTLKIYLGTKSSTTYSSSSDWTPMSDLTLVYDATNVTVGSATGWQTFTLNNPFYYDGSENLVVVVAKTMPSWGSTYYYYTYESNACLYRGSDSDAGYATHPGTSSGNLGTYRSNITISISPASGVCAKPKNLAMSNITESSADLQWLDTNAVSWDIYLTETQSDVPDSNTVPTDYASTTSYSFSGLNSSTVYYAYVRANCGDGTTSGWKEISFMTSQVPAQLPYSCDFEDATENANWMLIGQNTNKWVFGTAVNNTPDGQTGLYVSNDNGATNNYSHTTSTSWAYRDINLDNAYSEYNISFDFKGVGESASYDNLRVYIGDPVNPPASSSSSGACPSGAVEIGNYHNESNWIHPSITLDNTYAGVKRLYFLWWNDSGGGDSPAAAVDNLVVTGTNCGTPRNLVSVTLSQTSASFSFHPASPNDYSWQTILVAHGDTIDESQAVTISDTTYEFINLTADTPYDIYVRTDCGGEYSFWSQVLVVRTSCQDYMTIPYTETFDTYGTGSNSNYPSCWTRLTNNSSQYPYISSTNASAPGSLYFYSSSYSSYYCCAIAPEVDVNSTPVNTLSVTFKIMKSSTSTGYGAMQVGVMTNPNDVSTFTPIQSYTGSEWTSTNTWYDVEVPLTSYTGNGSYIALYIPSSATSYTYVDDFRVDFAPSCERPTSITATSSTTDEVSVSWVDNGGTMWDLIYGPTGFDPETSTDAVIVNSLTTTNYTVSGLAAGTMYDFYVRRDCGAGDVSAWTLSPATAAPYLVTMGVTGSSSVTGCDLIIVDNGGLNGNYSSNCSYYLTIYPSDPDSVVSVSGTIQAESASYDYIIVYDGACDASTADNATQLYKSNQSSSSTVLSFGPFTSETGPLTLFFRSDGSNEYSGIVVHSTCMAAPTCRKPSNFASTGVTSSSVTLSWTENGYASSWNVAYGPTGFTPSDTSLIEYAYDTTATIYSLTPGVTYDFYVQADCGGDYSDWTGPVTVTPGTYNMAVTGTNTISMCGGIIYDDGGANGNYSNDCQSVLVIYPSETDSLVSISGTFAGESSYDYLEIYEGNGTTQLIDKISASLYGQSSGTTFNFGPFTSESGPLTILFHSDGSTTYAGFAVNVNCVAVPTCRQPSNFVSVATTPSSVSLSWTELGDATAWNVAYGPTGFTPDANSDIEFAYDTAITINNLTASVSYDFYVQSDCGGDYSDWTGPLTIVPGTYNMAVTGTNTISMCGGIIYDNGGANGNYSNDCHSILTIYPSDPDSLVSISGTFAGESSYDYLEIYEGNGTTQLIDKISASLYSQSSGSVFNFGPFTSESGPLTILFHSDVSNNYAGFAASVNCVAAPTCRKVYNISAQNVASTDATIEWAITSTNYMGFNVAIGSTADFDPDTCTNINNASTTSYQFTGLTANTTYYVKVQTDCGGGDVSDWSNVYTFITDCDAITTLPYTDNFDTYGTGSTIYPACWSKINTYSSDRPYISTTNYSAPGSLYFFAGNSGTYNIAITPQFDASIPVNTLQATFMYKGSNSSDKLIIGVISDPLDASTFTPVDTVYNSTVWDEYEVNFANYTGNGQYIAFKNLYNSTSSAYAYLDNLYIETIPTCPRPHNLVTTGSTSTSVTVSWLETGSAAQWEVEYGPAGFTQGNGTVETATTNPYTIASLNNTVYDIYVRSDCGGGDYSIWTGPLAVQPGSYNIPANGTDTITACDITIYDNGGVNGNYSDNCSGYVVVYPETPGSVLSASGSILAESSSFDYIIIYDGVGTANQLYKSNQSSGSSVSFGPIVSTTGPLTIYFRSDVSNNYEGFHVDLSCVTCIPVSNLTATNISDVDATINWNSDATNFNVIYGPAGFDPEMAGTTVTATTTSYTLTGLSAGTTYDVYVQTDCGNGDYSSMTMVNFTTQACSLADQCEYTFICSDDYGDGWNDGYLTVEQNGAVVASVEAINHDYEGETSVDTFSVFICSGVATTLTWHTGSYDDEVGISVIAPDGTSVISLYDLTAAASPLATFTPNCAGTPSSCDAPTNLAVSNITTTGATATWTAGGTETAWNLQYKAASAADWSSAIPVSAATYTFTGLTPNTQYQVRVQAACDATTTSDWTAAVNFTTAQESGNECAAPSNLASTGTEAHTITITWTENGTATSWTVYYRVNGASSWITETVNATTYTITGLEPETEYTIQVVANCADGEASEPSNTINVTTQPDGIEDYDAAAVSVFPNPTTGMVQVSSTKYQVSSVDVYDVYGKLLKTDAMIDNNTVNMSGYAAGVYFLRVFTENGVVTKRVVKR